MAFLLILDREHKVLWVKMKNHQQPLNWALPELEDPMNQPVNRLNVELLAKQAFIPLKSVLVGKEEIFDIHHNTQIIYIFLCLHKESTEVLFDLTKYQNIQWLPLNSIKLNQHYGQLMGKSILKAYLNQLTTQLILPQSVFHIVKNGKNKSEVEKYNHSILQKGKRLMLDLELQYKLNHQPLPRCGEIALLNNWDGFPVAILEITKVFVLPFKKLNQQKNITCLFDDKSIFPDHWHAYYQKKFKQQCQQKNQQFSVEKKVVLSQFEVKEKIKPRLITD